MLRVRRRGEGGGGPGRLEMKMTGRRKQELRSCELCERERETPLKEYVPDCPTQSEELALFPTWESPE